MTQPGITAMVAMDWLVRRDALARSVFVGRAALDIWKYFKDLVPGWQGENLQQIWSIAVFVSDGREERQKAEQVKEKEKRKNKR